MNTFLLDLWHDLRAKRLWPVAVLLAIALVAVPVLLRKHASSAPVTPAAAPSSAAANASKAVVVADTDTAKNSSLGDFQQKNPFRPAGSVLSAAHPGSNSGAPTAAAPQSGGSSPAPSTPASQPTHSTNPGGSANSGGGVSTPPAVTPPHLQPKTTLFGFTVDVKFGKFGSARVHHGLQALEMLPNQTNPLVVFMGVTATGDTAVFLLDSGLKAAGEGSCKPSGKTCSFLYLKLNKSKNSEELFKQAADGAGTEYTLQLLGINRVPLTQLSKIAKSRAAAARKAARKARATKPKVPTPFVVPFDAQLLPAQVAH